MTETAEVPANGPQIIILGVTGSGKSALAEALAESTGLAVVEVDALSEQVLGASMQDAFVQNPQRSEEVLLENALKALEVGAKGFEIVVLTPSAGANPAVLAEIGRCKQAGSTVVAVDAPLDVLARRAGLVAAQPGYLGTPRAWFRSMHQALTEGYATVAEEWFDTETQSPWDIAVQIAAMRKLDLQPDTERRKRE